MEKKIDELKSKIRFKDNIVFTQADVNASFDKIKKRIETPQHIELPTYRKVNLFTSLPFRVAASIAVIFTLSYFGLNYYTDQQQIVVANNTDLVQEVVLPDGSKVSLRSKSNLVYRKSFSENRNVELQGEALFEVAKNKDYPFTVETKQGTVTVLGTVFSVRAFEGENYTRTLLKEGRVQFADLQENETVILTPGQEAKLVKGEKNIQVKKVKNMDRALAWHSHNFSFDNETLESILAVLSDAYDKKLQIKDKTIGDTRYTLKFNKGESLRKMLEILSEVASFKHTIKDDLIIIEKK